MMLIRQRSTAHVFYYGNHSSVDMHQWCIVANSLFYMFGIARGSRNLEGLLAFKETNLQHLALRNSET